MSSGLPLGACKCVALPGPSSWTDGPVRIPGVWFEQGLQLVKNWSKAELGAAVWTWVRRRLTLKGMPEGTLCTASPHLLPNVSTPSLQVSLGGTWVLDLLVVSSLGSAQPSVSSVRVMGVLWMLHLASNNTRLLSLSDLCAVLGSR